MKMRKNVETPHATNWLQIDNCCFYTNFAVFKTEIYGARFKRCLPENETLNTHAFYMKMNRFNIVFHMT